MKQKSKSSKARRKISDEDDPLDHDLSAFIAQGGWQVVRFELTEKKDKVLSIRMSDQLLREVKREAQLSGLGVQKFLRLIIERSVKKKNAG